MRILITGSAGFIGFHTARRFLEMGNQVIGFDGFTSYYDPVLKNARERILQSYPLYTSISGMLQDDALLRSLVATHRPELVVHLAAQAGVRYSLENPGSYIDSNIVGTFNLLEALREHPPRHLMFSSTSSVYGGNQKLPFHEESNTSFPLSLYAATKAAGESMTHSYSNLYNIPTTCFRFFTVYGPWGRPDMALFKFLSAMSDGRSIEIYGQGDMYRDFTYIDDLVDVIEALADRVPETNSPIAVGDTISPVAPWRLVNVGGGQPQKLMDFVRTIEEQSGLKAKCVFLPMQNGDVVGTAADPSLLRSILGRVPETPMAKGVGSFVSWYNEYHP